MTARHFIVARKTLPKKFKKSLVSNYLPKLSVPNFAKLATAHAIKREFLRPIRKIQRIKNAITNGIIKENLQRPNDKRKNPLDYTFRPVRNRDNSVLSRVCNSRRVRRRAIFAISRQGSGHRRPNWQGNSRIRCK